MKTMKKVIIIILVCIFVLFAVAAGIAIWQRDNIHAFFLSRQYSETQIETMLEENSPSVEDALEEIPELQISDLTEEDIEKLKDGSLSEEEAIDIMLGRSDSAGNTTSEAGATDTPTGQSDGTESNSQSDGSATQTDTSTTQPSTSTTQPGTSSAQPDTDTAEPSATLPTSDSPSEQGSESSDAMDRIAELVATIFVYQQTYSSKLENIMDSAAKEYNALPDSEQTTAAKQKLVLSCIQAATTLEKECDGKVNAILDELRTLLKETGNDLSLVDEIKSTYANQKALIKASYLSIM